jgi:hypothetical protein
MKITTDGIIGSAARINNQRNSAKAVQEEGGKSAYTLEIGSRVNTRLDAIDGDLRTLQDSLTRGQTVRAVLNDLLTEVQADGGKTQSIIDSANYNGKPVLQGMFNGVPTESDVRSQLKITEDTIRMATAQLTRLSIETENIFASHLGGEEKIDKIIRSTETIFLAGDVTAHNRLSSLNADVVMRLIR